MSSISDASFHEFRHEVVREAAYQMQLPSERAGLHAAALFAIHAGTPAPEQRLVAAEQVIHASTALETGSNDEILALQYHYLVLAAKHADDNYQGAIACEYFEQLIDHPLADGSERLDFVQRLAAALLHLGRGNEAAGHLLRALAQARGVDRKQEGRSLSALAAVYSETGQTDKSGDLYERAIEILREQNDLRYLGIALTNRAILFRHTGRNVDVEALQNEALRIHEQSGNRVFQGITLMALAGMKRTAEDNVGSEQLYLRALDIFEEQGSRREQAQAIGNLANVYLVTNRVEQAEQAYAKALRVMRELGQRRSEALILGNLGQLLMNLGKLGEGRSAGRAATEILQELNDSILLPPFRAMYASHLCLCGDFDAAERQFQLIEETGGIEDSVGNLDHALPTLVRLRVAQSFGGFGPHRDPRLRDPARLDQADEIIARMRKANKALAAGMTQVVNKSILALSGLVKNARRQMELELGADQFNGRKLDEPQPTMHRAICDWLTQTCPDQLEYMKTSSPDLYQRLTDGITDIPVPDWRSEKLP